MKITNTKEEIRNRMLRKAGQIWGVQPSEIDSSFDPIVSLLIGACASQISEINSEANSAYARVADNLINLMTPDASSGSNPAHAIAHAIPTEASIILKKNHQFYTKKKVTDYKGNTSYKSAFFTNIVDCKLINTSLKYLVTGNHLIEFNEGAKGVAGTTTLSINNNGVDGAFKIYLGFPKTEENISLKNVSIYFENNDLALKDTFYSQLKNAKIKYQGRSVSFSAGIDDSIKKDKDYIKNIFSNQSTKMVTTEKMISDFYDKNYITITDDIVLNGEITNTQKEVDLINSQQEHELNNIHWLEVDLPNVIDANTLKYLYVSINCFPVVNKKLESTTYTLKDYSKIIPLSVNGTFLDIYNVSNQNGDQYKSIDKGADLKKGTYFLKTEHISRLNNVKAKDQLNHLIDLLKNEAAAFSVFGNEFLNEMILKLNQDISLLENKVSAVNLQENENKYIIVTPFSKKESIFIDYWTTIGEDANQIKSSTPLMVYKGSEVKQNNCFLVTTSIGGKDKLSTQEKIYRYRRSILSHERIVTKQDILALCFDLVGDALENATVEKKFMIGEEKQVGYTPNIVITLYKSPNKPLSENEWELIESNLLTTLKEQSHNILPYKILIKE